MGEQGRGADGALTPVAGALPGTPDLGADHHVLHLAAVAVRRTGVPGAFPVLHGGAHGILVPVLLRVRRALLAEVRRGGAYSRQAAGAIHAHATRLRG